MTYESASKYLGASEQLDHCLGSLLAIIPYLACAPGILAESPAEQSHAETAAVAAGATWAVPSNRCLAASAASPVHSQQLNADPVPQHIL